VFSSSVELPLVPNFSLHIHVERPAFMTGVAGSGHRLVKTTNQGVGYISLDLPNCLTYTYLK
jgi:hypothetical protein